MHTDQHDKSGASAGPGDRPAQTQALNSTHDGLGRRLRSERERRRITLASIAANTKISIALLEGLEREDVSRWPSGIYRRSFVRAYAAAIGVDPDEIAREFLARFPDPAELELQPTLPPHANTAEARHHPSHAPGLRLTLADTGATFKPGRLIHRVWRRWAAVGWDAGALLTIGLLLFVALDQFWMPLALAMLGYYGSSIVILGNTPGVTLFAQGPPEDGPPPRVKLRDLFSSASNALLAGYGQLRLRGQRAAASPQGR